MTLIKRPSELNVQTTIKVLIYGQPGLGKTTLALSSPDPVLFDFDNGVHRINAAHKVPTLQISSWDEVIETLQDNLSEFKTIVIDTAGKMLDYMSAYIIRNDPKMGQRDGSLSLKGYGARKQMFINFLRQVSMMGKHIIFVAHEKEDKEGDQKIIRPEIGGSSANDMIKELDLVGYMQAIGKDRTISFDPCEKFYGKNTCNLPSTIKIAKVVNENGIACGDNNFMASIFDSYQKYLKEQVDRAGEYEALIDLIKINVEAIVNADTANEIVDKVLKFEHVWDSKLKAASMISKRCAELGLKLNKLTKKYEDAKATTAA
ncbi:ATP-binding protein [Parabacteroides pacaensis]|uniref:ATP-binding protein n=1 Tax=Parabacteroides pacaensis TaxID=2086575 RepID=UPI000D11427F|nr:ATP-binding protein [Parabacteroides pacaensis]